MKVACSICVAVLLGATTFGQSPVGTAFTYQGQLKQAGVPVSGRTDFQFALFDADYGGNPIGPRLYFDGAQGHQPWVSLNGGLFAVQLDFGDVFHGAALWLEITVRYPSQVGQWTMLSPRQPLTAAPYALFSARPWTTNGSSVSYTGHVGIGTATPAWQLAIEDTQSVVQLTSTNSPYGSVLELKNTRPSSNMLGAINFNDTAGTYPGQIAYTTSDDLTFQTAGAERMRIDAAGQVGIGKTPEHTLDVTSAIHGTPVQFECTAPHNSNPAVVGRNTVSDNWGIGVKGIGGSYGVWGEVNPTTGSASHVGVEGIVNDAGYGENIGVEAGARGGANSYGARVIARDGTITNTGVGGYAYGGSTAYGIYGEADGATTNWAGYFAGNVQVTGTLSKGGGSFKIDHSLDPENKYLYHSFVESPDMMNIYNGNVLTDERGYATVTLPEWFEALNRDFRYQLTVIGQFAQAIVAEKIHNNRFLIRTDQPNVEVSWQVTGIRQDPFANANRIPVEEDKRVEERGKYLHPEAWGQPPELGIDYARHERYMHPSAGAGAAPTVAP
jgi:hypothetical protein